MSENASVPFLDLVTPHEELKAELVEVFDAALKTAGFIGGPMVAGFESEFAKFCDAAHCVGVGSGTDALRFAFMAAGIVAGDGIITVPHTFIATTEAISQVGAVPLFVDIDEATYNMDPAQLRKYLEEQCDLDPETGKRVDRRTGCRIAAVVPVHLYGQMADMDAILEIAEQHGLVVIEDACQAHGAEYFSRKENRWRKAGSMGRAAAFSFYPGKNLGACGEAGAVTTNDAELAQKIRMIRDHGQATKYYHDIEGYNGRLDAIQAGFLNVKLRRLPDWNEQRRQAASIYCKLLAPLNGAVVLPVEPSWSKAVYHLFIVRVQAREALQKALAGANIGTGIHYPIPLHLQKAYSGLGYPAGSFPVTEKVATEIVSLPMFPGLSEAQQVRVVEKMSEFLAPKATSGALAEVSA
jgi:dTDP-4-amino-4,6-dideoxygalactose transaminase